MAVLWLTVAVVLGATYPASRLLLDESIESFFPTDDVRLLNYLKSKRLFGGDEFVILAYEDPNLFDERNRLSDNSRQDIREFSRQVAAVPGIDGDTVQDLDKALTFPFGQNRIKEMMTGVLMGEDLQSTAVVARLLPESEAAVPRAETFARLRDSAATHDPPAAVVGEPIQVHDMFRYVEADGATLGTASAILLMAVIFILFRNLRWVLLPIVIVQATLTTAKAFLVLSGLRLSMVSSMLDSLIMIIGIATVMHVAVHFRQLRKVYDRRRAFLRTFAELAPPVTWTCLTTAVGFAALISSSLTPVKSFGIMMTIATICVLPIMAGMLPAGLLLGGWSSDPRTGPWENRIARALVRTTDFADRYPMRILAAFLAVFVFCGTGLMFLRVETDFSKNFRESSPIVRSLVFVEEHLGGAGSWEVNFPAPPVLDEDYLTEVAQFANQLRSLVGDADGELTKVIALTDGLALVPERIFLMRYSLTDRLGFLERLQPDFIKSLYNAEAGRMRIVLRAKERQESEQKIELISRVQALARNYFGEQTNVESDSGTNVGSEPTATGPFVLLAFLIESLLHDQLISFLIAALGIVLMVSVAFHRLSWGILSLVPNIFPIVLVIGTLGWLGYRINIGTAMIASVSLGLTVDSSIHYLHGYRRARRSGADFAKAIRETHREVGLALVLANIALIAGFSVLTLSHFMPLVYFGVLVSVAMIGGLLGNLVLLPVLLRLVEPQDANVTR